MPRRRLFPPWAALALLPAAAPAFAEVAELPAAGDSVVGAVYETTARYGETTPMLAGKNQVGFHELLWANPAVHSWMPGEGTRLRIPRQYILPGARREGIVLNLAEMRLYFYEPAADAAAPGRVRTYPVSIGRLDWVTPLGLTRVVDRLENPTWYPPRSVLREHEARGDELPRVVPPGPDNPLGRYALMLAAAGYFIHGTNRDEGIGMRVTHGCVRLRERDIAELVRRVGVGTPVEIVSLPIKVGLLDGAVYLEVHPEPVSELPMPEVEPALDGAAAARALAALEEQLPPGRYVIFWERVLEAARRMRGVPVAVGWDRRVAPAPAGRPELLWRARGSGRGGSRTARLAP